MDEYDKRLKVSVVVDNVDDVGKQMEKQLKKSFKERFTLKLEEGVKAIQEAFNKWLKGTATSYVTAFVDLISNTFKSAIDELQSMLEYSQLSNSQTRDLALQYGFSSSEAYGWSKALKAVGLESEEDLFYATSTELSEFKEAFEKYSNQYSELYDSGFFDRLQEYQYEMEDFKNEMTLEVAQFFMENKDKIKAGMNALITIMEWVVKGFGWILGNSSSVAQTSDIVSQYSTSSNTTNNASLNVTNTFNNVDSSTSTGLAESIQAEYRKVIQSMGG